MGNTIYPIDVKRFTETACPTYWPWFGTLIIGFNLQMVVIKNQELGVTSKTVKVLLVGWGI